MPNLKTTLGEIYNHNPCGINDIDRGWGKLVTGLGFDDLENVDLKTEVTIKQILDINGIRDALWALRCFDYIDYCMLLHDIAQSVLHIFEKKYPEDKRPRRALDAIVKFKNGEITIRQLMRCADNAYNAADAADAAAWAAAYTVAIATDAYVEDADDVAKHAAASAADNAATDAGEYPMNSTGYSSYLTFWNTVSAWYTSYLTFNDDVNQAHASHSIYAATAAKSKQLRVNEQLMRDWIDS